MAEVHEHYIDTFFRCITDTGMICENMITDPMIGYIVSGEMILQTNDQKITLKNGEAIFMRRNHLVRKIKQPAKNGEPFRGLFLHLNTPYLKQIAANITLPAIPANTTIADSLHISLPAHPFLTGLFHSLDQYFSIGEYPTRELIEAKLLEAVLVLLQIKPELTSVLFDFMQPWKPGLKEFMDNNFTCHLSIEQFAHYTGRSLSSFKRDFAKEFPGETPNQWIIKRRLEEAYILLEKKRGTPSDIYLQVGFKNLSHFSTAFKKHFGVTPSLISVT